MSCLETNHRLHSKAVLSHHNVASRNLYMTATMNMTKSAGLPMPVAGWAIQVEIGLPYFGLNYPESYLGMVEFHVCRPGRVSHNPHIHVHLFNVE